MNEYLVRVDGDDAYVRPHGSLSWGNDSDWKPVLAETAEGALDIVRQELDIARQKEAREQAAYMATRLGGPEIAALSRLDEAFNEFLKLESHHPSELDDFKRAICAAKYIVKARATRLCAPR